VLTGGAGARAMSRAFERVCGVRDGLTGIPFAGRTDAWILSEAARAHGVSFDRSRHEQFRETYVSCLADEVQLPGPRKGVMPGVRELLDTLAPRADVFLALLTGNLEHGARVKLEYFDLWRYFRCGAFGDDAVERNGLFADALARVKKIGGPVFAAADVVIVGDTPLDIAVARAGGARSVGVATGSYDVAALQAAGADAVLVDFSDLAATLAAMGLDKEPD